jgi:hypothetical protein
LRVCNRPKIWTETIGNPSIIRQQLVAQSLNLQSDYQSENLKFNFFSTILTFLFLSLRIKRLGNYNIELSNFYAFFPFARVKARALKIIRPTSWDHSTVIDIATNNHSCMNTSQRLLNTFKYCYLNDLCLPRYLNLSFNLVHTLRWLCSAGILVML